MSNYDNKLSYKLHSSVLKIIYHLALQLIVSKSKTYDSNDLNNSKSHIAYNATKLAILANEYFKSEMDGGNHPR